MPAAPRPTPRRKWQGPAMRALRRGDVERGRDSGRERRRHEQLEKLVRRAGADRPLSAASISTQRRICDFLAQQKIATDARAALAHDRREEMAAVVRGGREAFSRKTATAAGGWRCADAKDSGVEAERRREKWIGDDPTAAVDARESVLKRQNPTSRFRCSFCPARTRRDRVPGRGSFEALPCVRDVQTGCTTRGRSGLESESHDFLQARAGRRESGVRVRLAAGQGERGVPEDRGDDDGSFSTTSRSQTFSRRGRAEAEVADTDEDRARSAGRHVRGPVPREKSLPDPL